MACITGKHEAFIQASNNMHGAIFLQANDLENYHTKINYELMTKVQYTITA